MEALKPTGAGPAASEVRRAGSTPPSQALDQARFDAILAQLAPVAQGSASPESIKQVAQSFEAFFIQRIFSIMRESVPQDGLLAGGFAGGVYQDMLDGQLSQRMAAAGGLGLAGILSAQLGRNLKSAAGAGGGVDRRG